MTEWISLALEERSTTLAMIYVGRVGHHLKTGVALHELLSLLVHLFLVHNEVIEGRGVLLVHLAHVLVAIQHLPRFLLLVHVVGRGLVDQLLQSDDSAHAAAVAILVLGGIQVLVGRAYYVLFRLALLGQLLLHHREYFRDTIKVFDKIK